jgi:hypothetical protein
MMIYIEDSRYLWRNKIATRTLEVRVIPWRAHKSMAFQVESRRRRVAMLDDDRRRRTITWLHGRRVQLSPALVV